ncbi:hypothetical protein OHV05_36250 (plasmid) [Kitasatospora sp. NBC_00070]|uniref:hypothetical protein n=1 Tax=Kitasatospora sp. NBC_00070 TaxID=2975962 RepID=UPI00325294BE
MDTEQVKRSREILNWALYGKKPPMEGEQVNFLRRIFKEPPEPEEESLKDELERYNDYQNYIAELLEMGDFNKKEEDGGVKVSEYSMASFVELVSLIYRYREIAIIRKEPPQWQARDAMNGGYVYTLSEKGIVPRPDADWRPDGYQAEEPARVSNKISDGSPGEAEEIRHLKGNIFSGRFGSEWLYQEGVGDSLDNLTKPDPGREGWLTWDDLIKKNRLESLQEKHIIPALMEASKQFPQVRPEIITRRIIEAAGRIISRD